MYLSNAVTLNNAHLLINFNNEFPGAQHGVSANFCRFQSRVRVLLSMLEPSFTLLALHRHVGIFHVLNTFSEGLCSSVSLPDTGSGRKDSGIRIRLQCLQEGLSHFLIAKE